MIVVNCYDDKDIARGKVFIEKGGLNHFALNKKAAGFEKIFDRLPHMKVWTW